MNKYYIMKYNINMIRLLENSSVICNEVLANSYETLIMGDQVEIPSEKLKDYEVVKSYGNERALIRLKDCCAVHVMDEGGREIL